MKKRTIKKYAHELVKSMRYWTDDKDMGYWHYKASSCKAIKGKRVRQLIRDEVIAYVNDNIRPLKPLNINWQASFNKNGLYVIACHVGREDQWHRPDDFDVFDVRSALSRKCEEPIEGWLQYHQWVCNKPILTELELDSAVNHFMRSNGYEIISYWSGNVYVNNKGDEVSSRDAHIWYLTSTHCGSCNLDNSVQHAQ